MAAKRRSKYSIENNVSDFAKVTVWLSGMQTNGGHKEHPATEQCGYYDDEQWAFIKAMDRLKRSLGRMPTYSEVLERAKEMGYVLAKTGEGR